MYHFTQKVRKVVFLYIPTVYASKPSIKWAKYTAKDYAF